MDKTEYRLKLAAAERKEQVVAQQTFRNRVVDALEQVTKQNHATESQAERADRFHRRIENLALRLEGRKYRLEIAETLGLWVAAVVGVAAILVSSHDSDNQTKVMRAQQEAMLGQLQEMKGTSLQTDQIVETNRRLAEAATKQAEAAIETVRTARDNLIASQRAWVGPRNAKSDSPPQLEKALTVTIEYQNSGREPALETIVDTDVFVASKEDDLAGISAARINAFINKCKIKWDPTQKGVVFPAGLTGSAYEITKIIDGSIIDQDVVEGSKVIFVDGCFVYKSAGAVHRSSFCYFYTANKTKPSNWNICTVGNDAD